MSLVQAEIRRPSVLKKSTPFELMGPNVSKAIGMKVYYYYYYYYYFNAVAFRGCFYTADLDS